MTIRFTLIALLTVLMFSCSEQPQSTQSLTVNKDAAVSQSEDTAHPVNIRPLKARKNSTIILTADSSLTNGGTISWYINGRVDKSAEGFRFSSNDLSKGDIVQTVIVNSEEKFHSNEITIHNTPPLFLDAGITPAAPKIGSILQVNIKANDIDNDTLSYKYEWSLNDTFAGEENYLEADLKRGDNISVTITPYDGEEYGRPLTVKTQVRNSLPVFTDSSPSFQGELYEYQLSATDPDGDILLYSL